MIAERIKFLREQKSYTQTELAKKLGITRSSVNACNAIYCRIIKYIFCFNRLSARCRKNFLYRYQRIDRTRYRNGV